MSIEDRRIETRQNGNSGLEVMVQIYFNGKFVNEFWSESNDYVLQKFPELVRNHIPSKRINDLEQKPFVKRYQGLIYLVHFYTVDFDKSTGKDKTPKTKDDDLPFETAGENEFEEWLAYGGGYPMVGNRKNTYNPVCPQPR